MSDLPLSKEEIQERLGQSAFIELLNLTVLSADPVKQQLVMLAAMRPEFERGRGSGQWHGGPIAAIIDTAGDYALVMLLGAAAANRECPGRLSAPGDRHRVDRHRHRAAQRQAGRCRRRRCGERGGPAAGDRPRHLCDRGVIWRRA